MERTITIPTSWDDVTLEQYARMDLSDLHSMLSVLWNLSPDEINGINMEIDDITSHLHFLTREPQVKIDVDDYVNILELKVGEIADLEELCINFKANAIAIGTWLFPHRSASVQDLYSACVHAGLTSAALIAEPQMDMMFATMHTMSKDPVGFKKAVLKMEPSDMTEEIAKSLLK